MLRICLNTISFTFQNVKITYGKFPKLRSVFFVQKKEKQYFFPYQKITHLCKGKNDTIENAK